VLKTELNLFRLAWIQDKTLRKQSHDRILKFQNSIEENEDLLDNKQSEKKKIDEKLKAAEEESRQERGTINELEKELKELRKRKEVNLELIHHLAMAREKLDMKAQSLSDHIWETYGILMKQVDVDDYPKIRIVKRLEKESVFCDKN
jgi:chromosome segregation protein